MYTHASAQMRFIFLSLIIDLSLYQEMPMKSASNSFIYFLSYVFQEVMMMMIKIKNMLFKCRHS